MWVDRGAGLERSHVRFADDAAVRRLAVRLAAPTGRRLDDAQPWVDARLADGVRLHAVLPPVVAGRHLPVAARPARHGVHAARSWSTAGRCPPTAPSCSSGWCASRQAFLVSGGTGTGKTTLLSALLSLVRSRAHRLLLVEDAGELLPGPPARRPARGPARRTSRAPAR